MSHRQRDAVVTFSADDIKKVVNNESKLEFLIANADKERTAKYATAINYLKKNGGYSSKFLTNAPDSIQPGSVGEYLYGCSLQEGSNNVSCTPSCINGLAHPSVNSCEESVYERTRDGTMRISTGSGPDAHLYISISSTTGTSSTGTSNRLAEPTVEERAMFHKHGVSNVRIYDREDGVLSYTEVGKVQYKTEGKTEVMANSHSNTTRTSILKSENRRSARKHAEDVTASPVSNQKKTSSSSIPMLLLFLLILLIIIMVCIYCAYG